MTNPLYMYNTHVHEIIYKRKNDYILNKKLQELKI